MLLVSMSRRNLTYSVTHLLRLRRWWCKDRIKVAFRFTVSRRLLKHGLKSYVVTKISPLAEPDKLKRLNWCNEC